MIYRCWEEMNCSEPQGEDFESDGPAEAAEQYCEKLDDLSDVGANIIVNVSAQSSTENTTKRDYWTVDVSVDWSPNFSAWEAEKREDAP